MKILRKAGTVLLAAVMCLSSFFAENVHAQESDKEPIFEYLTAFNSSGTFTPPRNGLYKIYCVGKSGDGYTPTNYNGGGGGGSGGIAVSNLILSAKESYSVTVTESKSGFGTELYATAGKSSTGTGGGTGGRAYGGNVANDGGYKGGHSGSNTQNSVGEDGLNGGMKGGYHVGLSTSGCIFGGGGGGGARLPADHCPYVANVYTNEYQAGGLEEGTWSSSEKRNAQSYPYLSINMHMKLYGGAGGGGESGRDSGHRPDSNHSSGSGGKGQPALIIFEKAVAPTEPEIMVTPDKTWLNHLDGNAAVTLFSDELDAFEDAKLMYSFDNSSWTEYSTPLTVKETATIYGKVTFADGQSETSQKEIKIDPLSPSISSANVDETDMEHRFLTVTAKDTGGSGVKCIWIDDTPYTDNPCTYPIPDGKETVMLKVEDVAGNLSEPKEQVVRYIDTIPPTIDTVEFTKDLSVVTIRMSDDTYGDGVKGVYINGTFKTGNPILWAVPEDVAILRLHILCG